MKIDVKAMLKKIKDEFTGEPIPPAVIAPAVVAPVIAAAPVMYKTPEGVEVAITQAGESPAPGDTVTVAGSIPPAGDIMLDNGWVITVDASGIITAAAQQPVTVVEPLAAPTVEERLAKLEEMIAALQVAAPAVSIAASVEVPKELTDKIAKQTETIQQLFALVEKIGEQPTAEPKTLTDRQKQKFEQGTVKEERLQRIAATLKNNKALS